MALKNIFGDMALEETLQTLVLVLSRLSNTLGLQVPDSGGRIRTYSDLNPATTVAVSSASAVNNVVASGGINMQYDQYGQMMQGPLGIRNRIETS